MPKPSLPKPSLQKPGLQKPSLQLIHCSNGIRPGAKRSRSSGGFRPFVIPGGLPSVPAERSWQPALELIGLGFLVSYANYLVLLEAGTAVLASSSRIDHEKAG